MRRLPETGKSVVYAIRNRLTGDAYVGSTRNFAGRRSTHMTDFRRGKNSPALQVAWDAAGESPFESALEWITLEIVPPEGNLLAAEQRWLEKCGTYNQHPNASSGKGWHPSEEARRKAGKGISAAWTPERRADQAERLKLQWTPGRRADQAAFLRRIVVGAKRDYHGRYQAVEKG